MPSFLFDRISSKVSSITVTSFLLLLSSTITAEAKPIKINTATTFDFKGCAKSSDGSDVICVGSFRNRDADKEIDIYRSWGNKTSFTDFTGKSYVVDEIKVANGESCGSKCNSLTLKLVEGVDYQTYFIFKDVNISSPQIALLAITLSGAENIKIRRISLGSQVSSSSEAGNENNNAALKPIEREERETSNHTLGSLDPEIRDAIYKKIARAKRPFSPDGLISLYFLYLSMGDSKKSWDLLPRSLQNDRSIHPNGYNSFADSWKDATVRIDSVKLVSRNNMDAVVNADVQYVKRNGSRPFRLQYTLGKDTESGNWAIATVKYR